MTCSGYYNLRWDFTRNSSATTLAVSAAGPAGCTSSLPVVGDGASAMGVDETQTALLKSCQPIQRVHRPEDIHAFSSVEDEFVRLEDVL